MILGLLKEQSNEPRVALLPETVQKLISLKVELLIEDGAGEKAFAKNKDYEKLGAKIVTRDEVLEKSKVLLQIGEPDSKIIEKLKQEQFWISVFNPLWNTELAQIFKEKGLTTFSLDCIPRTSRAQSMDILSSMATIAGYKSVLDSAVKLPTFFPLFMTAAGTIRPANVLILGAGVAGLQAIATARRLGAQVSVFDVRSAVKEQVLSLGAKFVEVEGATEDNNAGGYAVEQTDEFKQRQKQAIHDNATKANVIICTAQIPGKKAPVLITKNTLESMQPGSVVIDLAASTGGNCEATENDKTVYFNKVSIIGESNYASQMPIDGSRMFGQNVFNFLKLMITEEGNFNLNFEDDIVKGTCITHNHEIYNERVKSLIEKNK